MAIDQDRPGPDGAATADPYLSGNHAPVHDELDVADLEVDGEIPEALDGVYLRNGPNPAYPPIGRYHVFDGDGMVHAVELRDGRARYRNRFVESKGLTAERRAGRALFGGLSEYVVPDPELVAEVGLFKNTANTNVVGHAGRILALMEAAPPTELRSDLSTVGEYDFGGRLAGAMTAHPKFDPVSGEMHFFGYGLFAPHLRYHVADATGELVRSVDIDLPAPVMMHDFVVTGRWVVLFDLPAVFDLEAMLGGGSLVSWRPDNGARIGLLPREATDGAEVRWFDVDPFYVFHFVNGWDDGTTVVVDGCRAPRLPTTFGDEVLDSPCPPSLHRWRIDADAGTVTDEPLDDRWVDFPRINDDRAGERARYAYVAQAPDWGTDTFSTEALRFTGLVKYDLETGDSVEHNFGAGAAGEAVFAANPEGDAEDDGWLLDLVNDDSTGTTDLVILDAATMDPEPVARVRMPRRVPFGFHGNWLPG